MAGHHYLSLHSGTGWSISTNPYTSSRPRKIHIQGKNHFRSLSTSRPASTSVSAGTNAAATRPLKVLAIESSADDSCISIVSSTREIISNIVISQHDTNKQFGGIHPFEALQKHAANLPLAIERCLSDPRVNMSEIDLVAYTRGPGMPGCLAQGAASAKTLAAAFGKPIMGIHHMQAHALTPLLTESIPPSFPFLTLLVSGGHTQLLLAKGLNEFKILATCNDKDIKVGQAFDKVAKLLNLPPTGPALVAKASLPPLPPFDTSPLPPLILPLTQGSNTNRLEFSFSGLVSYVSELVDRTKGFRRVGEGSGDRGGLARLAEEVYEFNNGRCEDVGIVRAEGQEGAQRVEGVESAVMIRMGEDVEGREEIRENVKREMARIFQDAAIGHLCQKVRLAFTMKEEIGMGDVRSLVVSGGVGSNLLLREKLREMLDVYERENGKRVELYFPPVELCTDNAAMIAWAAILRVQDQPGYIKSGVIKGEGYDLPIRSKWSLEDMYDGVDATVE